MKTNDPSENVTSTELLRDYAAAGYDAEMNVTREATVHCSACGKDYAPRNIKLDSVRRMEGASDPDDMQVVVALLCQCGAKGAVVLGYGPNASAEDGDVFAGLHDHRERSDIPSSQTPQEAQDSAGTI
jgi:hypothetical protein